MFSPSQWMSLQWHHKSVAQKRDFRQGFTLNTPPHASFQLCREDVPPFQILPGFIFILEIYVFIVVVVITITTRIIIVSTTWMDHSFFAVLMASESRNSTATWDPFCPHNQPTTVLPKCFVYDLGWSRAAHIRLLKRLSTKFGEVHPKLRSINFHNVTHSLISQNRRERMFVVQISLLIVTFLSPTSQNLSLLQTAKEVNPHSHIESCVNMWSVFFFLCHMLNADACVSHITRKVKWSGPH